MPTSPPLAEALLTQTLFSWGVMHYYHQNRVAGMQRGVLIAGYSSGMGLLVEEGRVLNRGGEGRSRVGEERGSETRFPRGHLRQPQMGAARVMSSLLIVTLRKRRNK